MTAYIYCLEDPITGLIRYIGYTTSTLKNRLRMHINSCRTSVREQRTHRAKWINKLLKQGVKPLIRVLIECAKDKVNELEKLFIAHYKQFCRLVNGSKGGDGSLGHVVSLEARKKMSKAWKPSKYNFKPLPVDITEIKTGNLMRFSTKEQAANYLNCSASSIHDCISGRRNSIYGHTISRSKILQK